MNTTKPVTQGLAPSGFEATQFGFNDQVLAVETFRALAAAICNNTERALEAQEIHAS